MLFSSVGSFPENIAGGTALGTLSCINVTGTPVYTLLDTDVNRVTLSGSNISRGALPWDYETHPFVTLHRLGHRHDAGDHARAPSRSMSPTCWRRSWRRSACRPRPLSRVQWPARSSAPSPARPAGSSLSLTDDAGGRFAISGTNLVTAAIPTDYETSTLHAITIRETHPDAAPRDTALAVTVTNVVEIGELGPFTLSANTILEGSAAGTMVGGILGQTSGSTLELFDDAGDRFAFGVAGDPTLTLDLDFTTGTLDSKVTFTRTTTATYVNASGVVMASAINAARFDHNPATLAPRGLLLEEQRTNLVLNSTDLSAASWTKALITVNPTAAVAPDGTTTANRLTASAGSSEVRAYQALASTNMLSIYAKAGTWNFLTLSSGGAGQHVVLT